jgi:chitinase
MKNYPLIILFLVLTSFYSCKTHDKISGERGIVVMAYYYVPSRGAFHPENLPLDKLTHIIYSFTEVIGNEMKFEDDSSAIMLKMLVAQKKKQPHLKVMVACGGWSGSGGFSEMARSEEHRKKFIESVIRFIREFELDGLDIDWEYPGMEGVGNPYIPEDKENFTSLMRELREAMDKTGKEQVLTFAAAGWEHFFDHIELEKVMQYVTYINIMTYDMAGEDDTFTSHHTNLGLVKMGDIEGTPAATKIQEEGDSTKPWSAEKIISFCLGKGVKPGQIVIGAAFYGKGWMGVPPENNGLYELNRGPWTGSGRYSSIREKYEDKNGFVRYWDPIAKAPFLYNARDSIFVSYEDTVSIRLKTEYAVNKGLGGIMFWQLGSDTDKDGLVDAIYAEKMRLNKTDE